MLKLLQKTRRLVDLLQCIPLLILCIRKYAIYNYLSVNSNRNQSLPSPPPFMLCLQPPLRKNKCMDMILTELLILNYSQ